MKKISTLILVGVAACAISAKATFLSGTGPGGTILDNDASGLSSTIMFNNTISSITDVRVHLNITGGYNGDLYAYLTHDGATAILLNRIGTTGSGTFGSSQAGMNIFLHDGSPDVHTAGTLSPGGTYEADGRNADPSNLGAVNGAPRNGLLAGFNNSQSFGSWTLFIADVDGGGGNATLSSWDLELTGVPEPVNVALGIFGGFFVVVQGVRYWKKKKQVAAA